jgi:hypothetical protein
MSRRKKKSKRSRKNDKHRGCGGKIIDTGGHPFKVFDLPGGGVGGVNLEFLERLSLLQPPDPQKLRWLNKWTTEQDLQCEPWFTTDAHGNHASAHASALATLARAGEQAGEVWLWCLHCARFFQARHLKLDFLGNWQRCPFDDCGAAGLDVDILVWDAYLGEDPRWPGSEQELRFGLQIPPWPVETES